jgi:hypothetical protein
MNNVDCAQVLMKLLQEQDVFSQEFLALRHALDVLKRDELTKTKAKARREAKAKLLVGKCKKCKGEGIVWKPDPVDGRIVPCPDCIGSGLSGD